jgi:hypothetical protein
MAASRAMSGMRTDRLPARYSVIAPLEPHAVAPSPLARQEDHEMGKFLLGLIIGIIVAGLAMTMNPHLPQELRASLASLTAQVMRSAGETADDLGNAAEEAAGRVERPADREPPAAPAPTAPAPAEPAAPANQGQTDQPR